MKIHGTLFPSRLGSGWLKTLGPAVTLCACLVTSAIGGLNASDETIGTLPAFGNGWNNFEFGRSWRDTRPSVYVEGTTEAILDAFVFADGAGMITFETVDAPAGVLRLTFHGTLSLHFDRQAVAAGSIRVGLNVPQRFGPGQAAFAWGNRASGPLTLLPGAMGLPVVSMEAAGALDASALQVTTANAAGSGSVLMLHTTPDLVVLTQVH
jgi:hypothetical protein